MSISVNFIINNLNNYDTVSQILHGDKELQAYAHNQLFLRPYKTKNSYSTIPKVRSFMGVDIDFLEQNRELKSIGDEGEKLVLLYEQKILLDNDRPDLAELVNKVQDGKGYDILSRNLDGSEKYIEVKTTIGPQNKPFFLSANEQAFLSTNNNYFIYRLYNFNRKLNTADFFILSGDLKNILEFTPISYRVSLK